MTSAFVNGRIGYYYITTYNKALLEIQEVCRGPPLFLTPYASTVYSAIANT